AAAVGGGSVVGVLAGQFGEIGAALGLLPDRLRLLQRVALAERLPVAGRNRAAFVGDENVAQFRRLEILLVLVVELQHGRLAGRRKQLLRGGGGDDVRVIGGELSRNFRVLLHTHLLAFLLQNFETRHLFTEGLPAGLRGELLLHSLTQLRVGGREFAFGDR